MELKEFKSHVKIMNHESYDTLRNNYIRYSGKTLLLKKWRYIKLCFDLFISKRCPEAPFNAYKVVNPGKQPRQHQITY